MRVSAFVLAAILAGLPAHAQEVPAMKAGLKAEDWAAYKEKFVRADGRVVDDGNGGISHSESQGYGLLLAAMAGDRAGFELIWTFTRTELLIRDDGLAAWRWEEGAKPHVTDINNATDGDILIAYALNEAGEKWAEPRYQAAARRLTKAMRPTLQTHRERAIMMPGVTGFSAKDRPDGPVVNPSYLIFEALPVLAKLDEGAPWPKIYEDGLDLLAQARFGTFGLPAEWVSLHEEEPAPAEGFPPHFSYNAIRVPLYLIRAGITDEAAYAPYRKAWADEAPAVIDLTSGRRVEPLDDPGYRILPAAIECVLADRKIDPELMRFTPGLYYPSTIFLLASSYIAERHPECL